MLCTQAELELHLQADFGVDPEDAATQLIESASAIIEAYVGRALTAAAVTGELHNGGDRSVWLRRPPVDTGEAYTVSEDGTALTEDVDFLVVAESGRLVRLAGSTTVYSRFADGIANISVDYTGGPTTVPDLARSVCVEMCARAFKAAAAWANADDIATFIKRLRLDTDEAEFRAEALEVANSTMKLTADERGQLLNLKRTWFA